MLGFYYFNEEAYYPYSKYDLLSYFYSDRRNRALAGYADGTYKLGKLALIAGSMGSRRTRPFASDKLNVRTAFAYTHGRYLSFPNAPGYTPLPNGGNMPIFVDASGNHLVRAPDFTASGSVNYRIPLGPDQIEFSVQPAYSSRVYFDFTSTQSQGPVFTLEG